MNAHPRDEELIDHAFGLMDPPAARRLDQHLAGCPDCRARRAALQSRLGQLDLLQQPVEAPEPLITDTLRRIRLAQPEPERPSWLRWPVLAAGTALAALALFGFPLWARYGAHPLTVADAEPAPPERVEGIEVALAPAPLTLDPVEPLPADPAGGPADLPRVDRPDTEADVTPPATPDLRLATAAPTATGTPRAALALERVDSRTHAQRTAHELAARTTARTPARPAVTPPPAGGRQVIMPAAAAPSPGPALITYAVAAADFAGPAGPAGELAIVQRGAQLSASNRSARTVALRVQAAGGALPDLLLPPGATTNLTLRGR